MSSLAYSDLTKKNPWLPEQLNAKGEIIMFKIISQNSLAFKKLPAQL